MMRIVIALILAAPWLYAQADAAAAESQRARQMMAAGRYADAVPVYEKLVQAMPANPGLRLNLAMALHLSGEDQKAIPQFEAVLKQQPNALPALMLLGASYLRTGNPAKAVPPLEKAMTIAPDDLQGRAMLADGLLMLDRYQAAIPHLRKLAAADPANPRPLYGLGRSYEAVAQQAFDALEKLGPDSPWWLMLAAETRVKLGRNTAAFALYRAVLDKQPAFRGAHAGLAEVYRKTDHADWAAAEDAAERKLPPAPCAVPSAECHFLKGRYEQALSLALARRTPESLFWQSRAANELARSSFAQLAKLPPSVESQQVLAELYRNMGRHADAIQAWKTALELAPGDPRLEQELLTSVYMARDYPAAEKMARALLAKAAGAPELYFILGDSLLNQQQPEQAVEPLRKSVSLRPDYPAAQAVLGRALMQLGQSKEAIPHLVAALPADTDGSLHFQLSRAYQDTGQNEKAAAARKVYQTMQKSSAEGEMEITGPKR
ncbi:MAG TPA: tetratricopeptide repeat protein [Paludibaculum sp.]|jgi:predicted Zn-dependent protease